MLAWRIHDTRNHVQGDARRVSREHRDVVTSRSFSMLSNSSKLVGAMGSSYELKTTHSRDRDESFNFKRGDDLSK